MSASISTKLTKLLNIRSPIVSAPMAYAATPAMVAAVINGGGIGFLGAGREPAEKVAETLAEARAAVGESKAHLVGVGFVGWVLDKFNTAADPRLQAVLDQQPGAIWLAYGQNLGKYIVQVREHNAAHGRNILVFLTVNTVDEAIRAVNEWRADVIVAQGAEAGGRGSIHSPPIREFLKAVVKAIPDGPPILAAGGITTGAQIASLLAMGAAGVVVGTRFLFTHECMFSDEMKKVLLEAGPDSTRRSPAYDAIFPPGIWPEGIQARCITNGLVSDYEKGAGAEDLKAKIASGDRDHMLVYAGTGVADVIEIQSTADVLRTLHGETVAGLETSAPHLII